VSKIDAASSPVRKENLMLSNRTRLVVLVGFIVLAAGLAIFVGWQSSRISLDVRLDRSAAQFAYLQFGSDGGGDVYILDTEKRGITQLTTNNRVSRVQWRADGESLILSLVDKSHSELVVAQGKVNALAKPDEYSASLSPDKKLFVRDNCQGDAGAYGWDNKASIFVGSAANNSDSRQIANGCFPSWSPDGQQITFASQQSGDADPEIYIVNSDGSNLHRLLVKAGADVLPRWSPDAKHIFFEAISTYPDSKTLKYDLYHVDVTGQNLAKVDSLDRFSSNHWSPDGQTFLYLSDGGSLCVVKADGSGRHCPSNPAGDGAWSSDGKQVAYKKGGSGPVCIFDSAATNNLNERCFHGTEKATFLLSRPVAVQP
jgi:Tol biopolymer transport system component